MQAVDHIRDRLSDAWLFLRYGTRRQTEVEVGGVTVKYWTTDAYSRRWFYPRYAGGQIHEEKVTRLLADHMSSCRCFADVGANLGFFTCLAVRLAPKIPVYAFEMNDLFFELLGKNIGLNHGHSVQACHAAVTDVSGDVSYERQSRAQYRPTLRLTTDPERAGRADEVTVQAISLDEFFIEKDPKPDLVKVDVEGAEANVLGGMRNLLARERPTLFVEVHPKELTAFRSTAKEVVSILLDYDYVVQEIEQMRTEGDRPSLREVDRSTEFPTNTMLFAEKRRT